ncbi:uncharacterized protein LOC143582100 [Bidens hawaiensis]|uniref:uncharacterized protein LOC143582100 n=1 Tax=Bidens hawaiensis TaxID=980011 RepID=UPI004049BA80
MISRRRNTSGGITVMLKRLGINMEEDLQHQPMGNMACCVKLVPNGGGRGYDVLSHIDGTAPPATTADSYEEWYKINAIVLQWIYETLEDDLLVRILVPESTALQAWNHLKEIFLNNKGARAAALELEFKNLTLKSMPSLEAYCQKQKTLGDQLTDVDCPVNDTRLVLQLVHGLPTEYDAVGSIINQTFPTWEEACHMLHSEQQCQLARELMSTP